MTLIEKFALAAVNADKGSLYVPRFHITYSMAGIAAAILINRGKAELDGKKLVIRDTSSSGDELIDEIARSLENKAFNNIYYLISSIPRRIKRFQRRTYERLEDMGILMIDQRRFLGLLPYDRYVIGDRTKLNQIVENIKKTLISQDKSPDYDTRLLISMLAVSGIAVRLLSKEEAKGLKNKIRLIKKGRYFEPACEAINLAVKAVAQTIAAASAGT